MKIIHPEDVFKKMPRDLREHILFAEVVIDYCGDLPRPPGILFGFSKEDTCLPVFKALIRQYLIEVIMEQRFKRILRNCFLNTLPDGDYRYVFFRYARTRREQIELHEYFSIVQYDWR